MNQKLQESLRVACLVLIAVLFLLPLLWMFQISFKTTLDTLTTPPKIIFKPVWDHYQRIFRNTQVAGAF